MARLRTIGHALLAALAAASGTAQLSAAPASAPAGDDEDLEVPAAAAPADAPVMATGTPASAAKPGETTDAQRIAELERRLAAVEQAAAARAPAPEAKGATASTASAPAGSAVGAVAESSFDPSPHSRPVPIAFSVGGYVQADYLHSQLSEDQLLPGGAPANQDRFYLRRARLRLDRGWEYAAATLDLDANTVSGPVVGIRLAEGSLLYRGGNAESLPPLVALTAGITDIPFGYELVEADRTAPFMERSLASTALFPTKMDAGVKVSGAASFLRYAVAIMNGEPVDSHGFPRDPNGAKDVIGRFGALAPVGKSFDVGGGVSFAEGKGFHAGTPAKKSTVRWTDTDEDGKISANELVGEPGSAATTSSSFDRWAFGLDLGFRLRTALGVTQVYGEAYVAQNYDRGFSVADPVTSVNGVDVRELGGYVAVLQDVTRYGVAGLRISVYDPNADVFETRADKIAPRVQTVSTISPMIGVRLPKRARLFFQYDFVHDYLGRDASGVPTDAKNDTWTGRLQVDL